MHAAYQASLNIARLSFDLFKDVLDDVPEEEIHWKPEGAGNTTQVLVTHSIVATRFWLQVGCGIERSLREYREGEREAAFVDQSKTIAALKGDIDTYLAQLTEECAGGAEETLNHVTLFADVPEPVQVTGYEAILRGLAHLREHVGEAQLMRDLWKAPK
jgi:hypothetical protein